MPDQPNDANQTNATDQTPVDSELAPDNAEQPPVPGRTPGRDEAQKLKDAPIADPPPPTSLKPH